METRESIFDFTHDETRLVNECAKKLANGETPSDEELAVYDLFNATQRAEQARLDAEMNALRKEHEEKAKALNTLATVTYNELTSLVEKATSRLERVEDGQTEQEQP